MINVGIGVCSYRRPELATNLCKSILNTINKSKYNITTVCSLDDKDLSGYDWIVKNFNLIYEENKGIAANKNRIIKYLENNDFIFIAEDDIIFYKEGWVDLYIKAIDITGYQHINFIVPDYRKHIKSFVEYEGITLGNTDLYINGVLMVMSKKCLEIIGGFDERYGRYGYEHPDFTKRCVMAGLYPGFHFHVMESSSYLNWVSSESCLSKAEKDTWIKRNTKLSVSPVKSIYNGSYKKAKYLCMT